MTGTNRTLYVGAQITKSFGSGSVRLTDIGNFDDNFSLIDRISITFPPFVGGVVRWIPSTLMSSTAVNITTDRLIIPSHTRQVVFLELPDAHMTKLGSTPLSETDNFVELTLSGLGTSPLQVYLTVKYRTRITVNL